MAFISIGETHIALGAGKSIMLFSVPDQKLDTFSTEKPRSSDNANEEKKCVEETHDCASLNYVTCGEISRDDSFLACVTNSKQLFVWEITTDCKLTNPSVRAVPRRCVKLRFTKDKSYILIADRSGDVYRYSTSSSDFSHELLLGHVSMLLDMQITLKNDYVITSDRDEKIRVSCYPNAYNIQSFCLHHKEFVSSIALMTISDRELLISGSGDGHIVFWDYWKGKVLGSRNASSDISSIKQNLFNATDSSADDSNNSCKNGSRSESVSKNPAIKTVAFNPNLQILTVSFYRYNTIALYKVQLSGDMPPSIDLLHLLELEYEPRDMQFDKNGFLWVLIPNESSMLGIFEPDYRSETMSYKAIDSNDQRLWNSLQAINNKWDLFKESLLVGDDFEILYKQRYDNIEAYMERKKERVIEKCKKMKADPVL